MKKSLYKSLIPKGLSVAILSANLMSSQLMSVYANEQVDENVIIEEFTELESESIPENLEKSESIDGQSNDEALLEEDSIEEESFESESASETDLSEIPDTEEIASAEVSELSMNSRRVNSVQYENSVSIMDSVTGEILLSFSTANENVESVAAEKIAGLNTLHSVNYVIDSIDLVRSSRSSSSINGNTMTKYTNVYSISATNNSENKIDETNNPLYPSDTLYDDTHTQRALRKVRVLDSNGALLSDTQIVSSETVDQTIINALETLNSNYPDMYYYGYVEVEMGFTTTVGGSLGYYSGISYRIDIRVKKYPVTRVTRESVKDTIPFTTEYSESENLLVGEEKIVQDGINGVATLVYDVTYVDDIEQGRELISEQQTLKPTNKIIARGVKEIKQESEKSTVPFKIEKVDNADLLVGQEEVSQKGQDGVLTTTYDVTYIRGQETSRKKVSEETTKEPVTQIIQVGTKEIKEEIKTEIIPFQTEYVENSDLLVGQSKEITPGANGAREITEEVTYVKGIETNRQEISSKVTKDPTTRILEVGSKEIKTETKDTVIPFEIEYTESEDLLVGEEEVVQEGKNGNLQTTYEVIYIDGVEKNRDILSEKETLKPTNKIIAKGVKEIKQETKKSAIPFKTKREDNDKLLVGQEEVSQKGQDGELTTTYEVTYLRGKEDSRKKLSEETTKEAVTHIIQVGTKEIKTEVKTETVPFETEYIENPDLLVTESNELTAGVNGSREVTYEVTYIKGQETDRKEVASKTLEDPITRVVEVGSKEVKTESKESPIPFETEYEESADLLEGQENIKQKGENGTLLTTYQVTYVNGEEVDREETATEVTVEPTTQIIEKGIRQVKEESKTEVVPFEIKYVDNPDMLVGEEKIVQEGVDGERTITENVYFVHGEEVDRQETSNEITLQPIKQIIEVGVKEVKVQDITESIEFETEYIDNADWLEGTQEILTPGVNGEALVTYEITYINGVESARKELNRVILVDPTTQVIEKGTKEAPKPAEGEQNTPGKDKPAKATLPETGEQGSHAIFTAASLAILAGLGLVVGGRKKEEE